MQVSIRSSRLAPLAKCPRDIVILNSAAWARSEWKQCWQSCFSSTAAFWSELHPCEAFLRGGGDRNIWEHQHLSEKFHKNLYSKLEKQRLPWTGLLKHSPPTWKIHQIMFPHFCIRLFPTFVMCLYSTRSSSLSLFFIHYWHSNWNMIEISQAN